VLYYCRYDETGTPLRKKEDWIMVKHVLMWQLKEEITPEQAARIKKEAKEALEGLVGVVPGLVEAHVIIDGLPTSNAAFMLDATLTDEEALKDYATHPAHVDVANSKVRPYTRTRVCMDYVSGGLNA
jgi:hypothetical protein